MKVKDVMQHPVMTADLCDPAEAAWATMEKRGVRHLVVVSGERVVGVLSDAQLGGLRGLAARRGQAVGELLSGALAVIDPDRDVSEAARLLLLHEVSCLPVIHQSTLVGIVTAADLLRLVAKGTLVP
jgi:acetoin utilization protein AcuB